MFVPYGIFKDHFIRLLSTPVLYIAMRCELVIVILKIQGFNLQVTHKNSKIKSLKNLYLYGTVEHEQFPFKVWIRKDCYLILHMMYSIIGIPESIMII